MSGLIRARLIKRYKRFLADVSLEDGRRITVHCPNTGAMTNCAEAGATVWLSRSQNPKRKYEHTWEYIRTARGHYIGINTSRANQLVKDGIETGVVRELQQYTQLRTEVKYGLERSRIDLLLSTPGEADCYVEVKSVTLLEHPVRRGVGYFPDAVSARGSKHLRELAAIVKGGQRAIIMYCVQHSGINRVRTAKHIDCRYGESFQRAIDAGVEVLAYKTRFNHLRTRLWKRIPFELNDVDPV